MSAGSLLCAIGGGLAGFGIGRLARLYQAGVAEGRATWAAVAAVGVVAVVIGFIIP